jgi:hypothetical protein
LTEPEPTFRHKIIAFAIWFGFITAIVGGSLYLAFADIQPINANQTPADTSLTPYERWAINTALDGISNVKMYLIWTLNETDTMTVTLYRMEIYALGHNLTAYAIEEVIPGYYNIFQILNVTEGDTFIWKWAP